MLFQFHDKGGGIKIPRFNSIYMGFVYDNNDPEKQGKCRLRVPVVLGDAISLWALPKNIYTGNSSGFFDIPQIGATVWVTFIEGNVSRPLYETGHPIAPAGSTGPQIPPEALEDYPNTSVFKTAGGHAIVFNNKKGNSRVIIKTNSGHTVTMDEQTGTVTTQTAKGQSVVLNNAGTATVNAAAIGIGDTHANLPSSSAAITKSDTDALNTSINNAVLTYFQAFNSLLSSSGAYANGSAYAAIAAGLVASLFPLPTAPNGSSVTRIKE
jgi:hypothetical protein